MHGEMMTDGRLQRLKRVGGQTRFSHRHHHHHHHVYRLSDVSVKRQNGKCRTVNAETTSDQSDLK